MSEKRDPTDEFRVHHRNARRYLSGSFGMNNRVDRVAKGELSRDNVLIRAARGELTDNAVTRAAGGQLPLGVMNELDDQGHPAVIKPSTYYVRARFTHKVHEDLKPSNLSHGPQDSGETQTPFVQFAESLNVDAWDPEPVKQLPPAAGEFFIALFAPKRRVTAILGDLEERFQRDVESVGPKRARLRYWSHALRSGGPLFIAKTRNAGIWAIIFRWLS